MTEDAVAKRPLTLREIAGASAMAAVVTTIVAAAFMIFVAFEQSQWLGAYWAQRLLQLLGVTTLWAFIVDAPLGLLRERRGWHRYAVVLLGAVALIPAIVIVLTATMLLTLEATVVWWVTLLIPVLLFGGLSLVFAQVSWMRRWGVLVLAAAALAVTVWWSATR